MKETYTIKPDGTKTYMRDDNAPQMRKVMNEQGSQGSMMKQLQQRMSQGKNPQMKQVAEQGRAGDTELAHVNPYEKMILKKMGGSGTINPRTGLREFAAADYLQRYPDVAADPYFGANPEAHWQQYGKNEQRTWDAPATTTPYNFNFPTDIMPSSSSYTGLPTQYRDSLMEAITPQLQQSIKNMPANIDEYTNQALGSYQQMMQNALRTSVPKTITGLANRGIINSTEGQNALAQTMSNAAIDASNKGYQTAMQQALAKANMPTVLGQLADLGKYSTSESSDPTQIYQTMAQLIQQMM